MLTKASRFPESRAQLRAHPRRRRIPYSIRANTQEILDTMFGIMRKARISPGDRTRFLVCDALLDRGYGALSVIAHPFRRIGAHMRGYTPRARASDDAASARSSPHDVSHAVRRSSRHGRGGRG